MMVNKKELVKRIHQKGYTFKDAETVLNDVISVLFDALVEDGTVHIRGFGTMEARTHSAHAIKDVQTGETIMAPASKYVKFNCSAILKQALTEGFARK